MLAMVSVLELMMRMLKPMTNDVCGEEDEAPYQDDADGDDGDDVDTYKCDDDTDDEREEEHAYEYL
jgi:hypothetical protein